MVSHHPTKSAGHRHCGSGDKYLVVAEEDSSKLTATITVSSKTLGMSCSLTLETPDWANISQSNISNETDEISHILVTRVLGNSP